MDLRLFKTRIESSIGTITGSKHWEIKIALISFAVAIFFSCPRIPDLIGDSAGQNDSYWYFFDKQKENPFDASIFKGLDPGWHGTKLVFRFAVPLLGKVTFLNRDGILILQYLLGIAIFFLSASIIYKHTGNKFFAAVCTLAIALIYSGKIAFLQTGGYFDAYAIAVILIAMHFNSPIVIFICVLFAGFTDERGLLASSVLVVYNYQYDNKWGFMFKAQVLSVLAAWVTYFLIRYFLKENYQMEVPAFSKGSDVGFDVLYKNKTLYLIESFKLFEGFWLIMLISVFTLIYLKKYILLGLMLLCFAPAWLAAFLVYDVDRSLVYAFPILFCAVIALNNSEWKKDLNTIGILCLFICLVVPTNPMMGAYSKYSNANWLIFEVGRLVSGI